MPGPPPIPTERKRMLGNPGHQRLPAVPTATVQPAVRVPRPARRLGREGMIIWRRVWKYAAAWLSQGTDLEILTRYVENLELRNKLVAKIGENYTTAGSLGQTVLNPLMRQLNQTERLLLQFESRLGFTPADRSRIGAAEVRAKSTLDNLNAKREQRQAERERMQSQNKERSEDA